MKKSALRPLAYLVLGIVSTTAFAQTTGTTQEETQPGAAQAAACTKSLANATDGLQRGRGLIAKRDWSDAVVLLRSTEETLLAASTGCSPDETEQVSDTLKQLRAGLQLADQGEQRKKLCKPQTNQAMTADIKAAAAQSQKKELREISALYDEAVRLWSEASESCEGNDKERAKRNLADTSKARAAIVELQGSGPQCESANRDASSLHDLARQAFNEKHWSDAAILFRKTADMWEIAAEQCSGQQAKLATSRREQSATDAHNAEFCAPLFDQAREKTQQLKSTAASDSPGAKNELSQAAELLWRDAASQCKGAALETALANAQRLAKERGTPLVAQRAVASSPVQDKVSVSSLTPASVAPAIINTNANAPMVRPTVTPAVVVAPAAAAPVAKAPEQVDIVAGDARFVGKFTPDQGGSTLSGYGKVSWANGDVFEGNVVKGKRSGKGKFTWASGQVFDGDWIEDTPSGKGVLRFANGDRYEGTVVNGVPHGTGKTVYARGDEYAGELANGVPHGKGTFVWKNGNRYDGAWSAGLKEGHGVYTWSNGDQWTGMFKQDVQTENGKLVRAADAAKTAAASSSAGG